MNSHEAYVILGIAASASQSEVKAAYRRLAKRHHPDVNKGPNAQAKFQSISSAYELLKDAKPRPQTASQPQSTPTASKPSKPRSTSKGYDYIKANKIYEILDGNAGSKTILLYEPFIPPNTVLVLWWRDSEYRVYFEEKKILPLSINVNPPGIMIRFKTQE